MKKLKKKTIDDAVVGVVTAILLIGVIVAVVSLIQTMYIPKIMEQREAEHMDKVAEQFTYLTSVIDGQAANPTNKMPIATSITLGSKELPYMLSMKAFGTLEILDNIRWINVTDINEIESYHPIGIITYSSRNAYFLNQNYSFEGGAMIVSQPGESNLMMIRPGCFLEFNLTSENYDIYFYFINISSVGEKTIASGYGTYPIQTESNNILKTITPVSKIIIDTPFSNAWHLFIRNIFDGKLIEGENYFINSDEPFEITFDSSIKVTVNIINIIAQIGPGWVEQ